MKNLYLIIPFFSLVLFGQQAPFHKQYYVNPFLINPSLAGDDDRMNLFLMHRSQWTALPDAPITSTLTLNTPIVYGKNGVGVSMFADQTGIFRRNGGSVAYGHRFAFSEKTALFVGGGLNVFDNRIDFSRVEVVQGGDPSVFSTNQNKTIIDGNIGLNLRVDRLDVGLAVNHLGQESKLYKDLKNMAFYRQEKFVQATVGYSIPLGPDWSIKPLISLRYFDKSPYQLDVNGIVKYRDKIWVAGTFRKDYGFSIAAGFKVYDVVTIGYSYDIITNNLKSNTGMSSEIIVGIRFGKSKKPLPPDEFVDTDNDGVSDDNDLEPDTEPGALVNFQGITIPTNQAATDSVMRESKSEIDSTFILIREQILMLQKDPISFYYDYDRSNLQGGQDDKLVKVARLMMMDPGAKLTLYGNADSSGSDKYNLSLAMRRARTVSDILTKEFKIDPSRIEIVSKGKRDPITPYRPRVNRRVDAEIIPSQTSMPNMKRDEIRIEKKEGFQVEKKEVNKVDEKVKDPENIKKDIAPKDVAPNRDAPSDKPMEESSVQELFPLGRSTKNELFYTVQLGVFKSTKLEKNAKNIQPLYKITLSDESIRYYSGIFTRVETAEQQRQEVKLNGMTDAFAVAFFEGQRITLERAKELEESMSGRLNRR